LQLRALVSLIARSSGPYRSEVCRRVDPMSELRVAFSECKLDFFGGLELRLWLCLKLALSFFPLPPLWVSARTAFVGRRLAVVCDLTTRLEECRHCALQAIEYSELASEVSLRFCLCLRPHRPFALRILRFLSLTWLWWSDCGVLFLGVQHREPS
jgi:hypothetical protein